jgi:hypothetical protein
MFEHAEIVHSFQPADIGRAVGRLKIYLVVPGGQFAGDGGRSGEAALPSEQEQLTIGEIGE